MTSELVKAYPFLSDAEANRFDTAESPSANAALRLAGLCGQGKLLLLQ
jgi:hypothetical protein